MTFVGSGSSPERRSAAFDLLSEGVQRFVWSQGWRQLRDIQEAAIGPILAGRDVIIAAPTAGGKTEAAFLPICSEVGRAPGGPIRALYISPLKALINDQFRRLDDLCDELGIPVHRWHGDVDAMRKKKLVSDPRGILLITPESLEALFVHRGTVIGKLFRDLAFVVVDEIHAFIGSERGQQVQSLLHRLDLCLRRRPPRIGLSATLGDMDLACDYLRPAGGAGVRVVQSSALGQGVELILKGYVDPERRPGAQGTDRDESGPKHGSPASDAIADYLFGALRGKRNLVFANSRVGVELYTDLFRRRSEAQRAPNEFEAHHGNLAKSLREDVEARLRDSERPCTAVCTSTLELGIDIGDVDSVAQIGCPPSVASLRQRLGRSGRRAGTPSRLRICIVEGQLTPRSSLEDAIRAHLVQCIAVVELLGQRWCEPPRAGALHLSTLVHQVLALIAQCGGARPDEAFGALCQSGPFSACGSAAFASLLRSMAGADLIQQCADGALLLGSVGERLVNHYSFYAVFQTPEEYRVIGDGRELGRLPVQGSLVPGNYLIFAGRRWIVVDVDGRAKVLELSSAAGGALPSFEPGGWEIHDRVRAEMLRLYRSDAIPAYLDSVAADLLAEGRAEFRRCGLGERRALAQGGGVLLPWVGDRVLDTGADLVRSQLNAPALGSPSTR